MHPLNGDTAGCLADGYSERRRRSVEEPLKSRRKVYLEVLILAVTFFCGVYFTDIFVRGASHAQALVWASVGVLAAGLIVPLFRLFLPADVSSHVAIDDEGVEEDDEDDEDGWDVTGLLLAVLIVPPFFLISILARNWILLGVILALTVTTSDPSVVRAFMAVAVSLIVLLSVEFGVVYPLSKRWGIPLD